MTQKKKKFSKILINFIKIHYKKIFEMKNQYTTQKNKNLSKILINFIKIQKLTLALKTSLHRS